MIDKVVTWGLHDTPPFSAADYTADQETLAFLEAMLERIEALKRRIAEEGVEKVLGESHKHKPVF